MRCFLSYATEDLRTAQQIAERLRSDGHRCFFDRGSLLPGDAFHDRIRREIRRAQLFIFLISPHSVAPGRYTHTEIKLVRDQWPRPRGRVIPVVIAETPLESWPVYLGPLQALRSDGNVVAEVVNEVYRRGVRTRWRRLTLAAPAILAAGLGTGLTWKAERRGSVLPHSPINASAVEAPTQPPAQPVLTGGAPPSGGPEATPAPGATVIKPVHVPERPKVRPGRARSDPKAGTSSPPAPVSAARPLPVLHFFDPALMVPESAVDLAEADELARARKYAEVEERLERIIRQKPDRRFNLALAQLYAAWSPRAFHGVIETEIAKANSTGPLPTDLARVVTLIRDKAAGKRFGQ